MRRLLLAVLMLAPLATASSNEAHDWRAKVDNWVLRHAADHREVEFLVMLESQADLSGAGGASSRAERGARVFQRLTATARRTQPAVIAAIEAAGAPHRAYWIANMIWVRGDLALVRALAERGDVRRVNANPRVALEMPVRESRAQIQAIEPNIRQTGAPAVFWAAGVTGEGIVVANQDTGVEWTHPALRAKYRGFNGVDADHSYNWHDAIHSGGGVCGPDSPDPCDDFDHGTVTMGVMVGDDGAGNQIGMAPGAQWIACRNMDQGVGTPATYAECFEFFVAPTDSNGDNPDPSRAPHVINNSWTCPPSEGCQDPQILRTVVENTRAAGIVVVASAGNSGSGCSSVESPSAIYDAAFTVGANNLFGEITQFSSRGPVAVDGSYRLKPDVSAPGDGIRSSSRSGGYGFFSGTSLSGPHVAGLAGLILSAEPCFAGDVDAIEHWITSHTIPFTTAQVCGDVAGTEVPNNTYGWGIIRSAFPAPDACDLPLAGAVTGIASGATRCVNRTTGASVATPLRGMAWNCDGAGLAASPGDRLIALIRGPKVSGTIGGSVIGMDASSVICRNVTTGQSIPLPLAAGQQSWDCSAAGLAADPGHVLRQIVIGTAD